MVGFVCATGYADEGRDVSLKLLTGNLERLKYYVLIIETCSGVFVLTGGVFLPGVEEVNTGFFLSWVLNFLALTGGLFCKSPFLPTEWQ